LFIASAEPRDLVRGEQRVDHAAAELVRVEVIVARAGRADCSVGGVGRRSGIARGRRVTSVRRRVARRAAAARDARCTERRDDERGGATPPERLHDSPHWQDNGSIEHTPLMQLANESHWLVGPIGGPMSDGGGGHG
jgi:hypothetical protein